MKRFLLFTTVVFLFFPLKLSAGVEFSGFIQLDKRILSEETDQPFVGMYNTFRLESKAFLSDKASALASLDLRYYDFSNAETLDDLSLREEVNPLDFGLWEGYFELYGFLLDGLDLRFGKQRIAWGTADKLNQTDNLNPDDFSDLLDFGRKLPSTALMGTYYLGDFRLIGVWLPSLRPALLPAGGIPFDMESYGFTIPDYVIFDFEAMQYETKLPPKDLMNSMSAAKLAGNLFNIDFSLSYFYGYDDIPAPVTITITSLTMGIPIEINEAIIEMGFPKIQVIGADLAGEVFSIGYWMEGGLYLPEEVKIEITADDLIIAFDELGGIPEMVYLEDKPYFKYTLGMDYTFKGGIYLNAQWMHGFFTEVGEDNLQDYIMAYTEKKFLRDELKLRLAGGLNVSDFGDFNENYAYIVIPETSYLPADNVELTLGTIIMDGKETTLFGQMKDQDQVFFKAKVSF
ncbi:MAG: hypothetical protein JSU92_14705 [Deltaproteobacteria bacterium]|nr:MAG: hypothetical protein JSU92_14705 [Deltaproteobacteria bacterium]